MRSPPRRASRLARERLARRGPVPFAPQRTADGARSARRRPSRAVRAGTARVLRALLRAALRAAPRRRQLHARSPRLREADRDRLLRRSRAVLPLADVVHLLADEL